MMKRVYLCDNSIDGIFTAIYQAWSSNYGHANIEIEEKREDNQYLNMELFAQYYRVDTDLELSLKVAQAIKEKISEEAYEMVCRTALSGDSKKADLIYRFLILGFSVGASVTEQISNEVVNRVFRINRKVNNEVHHFLGFLRFTEQADGILTGVIHPKNNIITLITPHFAERLPGEIFVIYDETRNLAAFHIPGQSWFVTHIMDIDNFKLQEITGKEDGYQELWKTFFEHVAITERCNPKLQGNNLPLHYRSNMTEFRH